jgi:RHS repeat-associated protein
VHLKSTSSNLTTFSQGLSSGATESIYLSLDMNGPQTILVGGSAITAGDHLGLTVFDQTLTGGSEAVSYVVGSSDTLSTIASALASAVNSDTALQGIGVSATSLGALITVNSLSTGVTTYRVSRPNTATETLVQGLNPNGVQTAVIGGTKSTGDQVTISIFDAGIGGGSKAETYNVGASDTLSSIASGLAALINGDSTLAALGISATSVSTVVNLSSTSNNLTTYAKSTSAGATETITLSQSTGITQFAFNNLNELTSTSGGGAARFQGTTNKPIVSAKVNSTAASLPSSTSFSAQPALSSGANSATVNVVDGNNNSVTNTYQIGVQGGPSASLSFDANGNCTTDQNGNTISYDAENRMIKIQYPGTGNYSTFVYDGLGHNVEIVETRSGSVTSTQQFVWCNNERCEARNSSGTVTAQFFSLGETIAGASNFYTLQNPGIKPPVPFAQLATLGALRPIAQLSLLGELKPFGQMAILGRAGTQVFNQASFDGSISEMTNSSGTVEAQYAYDPYGRATLVQGSGASDRQYAGYYFHAPSGLCLTLNRAYSASLGRWLNRDPFEESVGNNLYRYAMGAPTNYIDPTGAVPLDLGGVEAGIEPILGDKSAPILIEGQIQYSPGPNPIVIHGPLRDDNSFRSGPHNMGNPLCPYHYYNNGDNPFHYQAPYGDTPNPGDNLPWMPA